MRTWRDNWGGLVVVALFMLAVFGLTLASIRSGKITLPDFLAKDTPTPTATPTPEPILELLDYGRLTQPIPQIHIDEPAGALIIYVKNMDYPEAIGQLDEVARRVVLPDDKWVYYFDTLSGGTIYIAFRCATDQFDLPATERLCESSLYNPGRVPIALLYDNGFVSSQ